MKKLILHSLFSITLAALFLFSCQKKQIGFFNNHSPSYKKENNITKAPVEDNNKELEAITKSSSASTTNSTVSTLSNEKGVKSQISTELIQQLKERKSQKLSKDEKKQIKEAIRKHKKNDSDVGTIILVILAIILPPLAVALVDGITGPFWLSILLTILFYVPGLIYALWRIFKDR